MNIESRYLIALAFGYSLLCSTAHGEGTWLSVTSAPAGIGIIQFVCK